MFKGVQGCSRVFKGVQGCSREVQGERRRGQGGSRRFKGIQGGSSSRGVKGLNGAKGVFKEAKGGFYGFLGG